MIPLLLALLACKGTDTDMLESAETADSETDTETDTQPETGADAVWPATVLVTLDGVPSADTTVLQAGTVKRWTTGADGTVDIQLDSWVPGDGDIFVVASHPEARSLGDLIHTPPTDTITIALERYDTSDNLLYEFQDPGEPGRRETADICAHCHITINDAWFESPHRTAAKNPAVQDLYAGAAAAYTEQKACEAAGGTWAEGIGPGTGEAAWRCYKGDGALPALNSCDAPCEDSATAYGACADCHAPGIDGALGGRDLLEATGHAYDFGVHCDVCHKVDQVDLDAEPGVAGRLRITRPSEESLSPSLGDYLPLTFGPYDDVPHLRMGSVARTFFLEATICAGCHEQDQAALVPGTSIDTARWPDGRIPVHSTYGEWEAGPMNPSAPCQSCHMPADPTVGNSADLYNEWDLRPGMTPGWERPPGTVRKHAWYGPRQPESGMLQLAAAIFVETDVSAGELTASVRVKNSGPGHAIPTGEPLRSLVLRVRAFCDATELVPSGGDAVPDFGGYLDRKESGEDWSIWPGASVGDVVRVVERTGAWHDYSGFGPFGDRFTAAEKGMPVEHVVGSATVTATKGDVASFDTPLPSGDIAYRVSAGWPEHEAASLPAAGAPGFAFARVLADADGNRMVPHFRAVDVVSDNRLLPQSDWTSTHRFTSPCKAPEVEAVLVHRAFPLDLAAERGWELTESVMVEVRR